MKNSKTGTWAASATIVALGALVGCTVETTDNEENAVAQSLAEVSSNECAASYTILSQWNGGFKAEVSFQNKTSERLNWEGAFRFVGGEGVKSSWRSQLLSGGAAPAFQGESYNSALDAGDSVTFGFVGTGTPKAPTEFSLNGHSCSGDGSNPGSGEPSPSDPPPVEPAPGGDGDECDSTSDCVALFGSSASDCVDSQSSESWCACGDSACSDGEGGGEEPGDSECSDGVANGAGTVCCAASCGSCGGSGCASRPGGADACCSGAIAEAARSCSEHDAPCVLGDGEGSPGGGTPPVTPGVPQPPASCSNVGFDIPNYLEIHTVVDKRVERSEFPDFSQWYTESGNVQRFQLHEGDTNLANPNIARPRVEAYAPGSDRWKRTGQNDWHEFSANYYMESWDKPWLYAVFQIKTNDASNFILQGLIDKNGKFSFARRGKGRVTLDDNVFQKPFHLRVRSNGYKFEVYYNCELVLAENHPQPELESNNTQYGWRWGLYRQKEDGSDFQKGTTTLRVAGPKWN